MPPRITSPQIETAIAHEPHHFPQPNLPSRIDPEQLHTWKRAIAALNKPQQYQAWVDVNVQAIASTGQVPHEVEVALHKDLATFDASINKVRTWYKRAVQLGKNQEYLDRIQAVGQGFKAGQPLSEKAIAAMHRDMG